MTIQYDIEPSKSVLLIVDMLNEFLESGARFECPSAREMVPRLEALITACREAGIPVIYAIESHREGPADRGLTAGFLKDGATLHREGSHEVDVYSAIAPQDGDIVVHKRRHSAFYLTELEIILRRLQRDTVILSGVTSPICCESTARDALFRDFKVIWPRDLNECNDLPDVDGGVVPRETVQRVVCSIIGFLYGEVTDSEDTLRRIEHGLARSAR